MICYVKSSVILRYLLVHDSSFNKTSQYNFVGSSDLVIIECNRVLDRYRLENQISDAELAKVKQSFQKTVNGLHIVELTRPVKTKAAESFPTVIGTLNALHLSTLLPWK